MVDGKRVALIGYGCKLKGSRMMVCSISDDEIGSGVQIAPNIIDRVSKLYTWFRNKTYILPPPNQAFSAANGANFKCRFLISTLPAQWFEAIEN